MFNVISSLIGIGDKVIDKFFTSESDKAEAKTKLRKMAQDGELKSAELQMSAIIAEAKSSDPYVSRARPTFLYVIYIFILSALPMGVLFAFNPDLVTHITHGVSAWLKCLPTEIYWLFGTGYLGYGTLRTFDKNNNNKLFEKLGS